MSAARSARWLVLAAAAAVACGIPEPEPHARVAAAHPQGDGVPPELDAARIVFTAPVAPDGLVNGARLVLVPAAALRAALAAVESEAGAAGLAEAVPAAVALADGGVTALVVPAAPLRPRTAHALVLSSRAIAADGRPVLDSEGRRRPTVAEFTTGAVPGPPPLPVLTEVRADAATPEAGGEYVEIANLGDGALDLAGWRLSKRTASGGRSSCALVPEGLPAPPGAVVLAVGGAYDGRYPLPAGTALATCGATSLLGGIANDRVPDLALLDPSGAVVSTLGAAGGPRCGGALVRVDPEGADAPENLACAEGEGTPGEL